MVRSKSLKPTERYCVLYAGTSDVIAVHCRGFGCVAFVRVPIRKYKVGGAESHEWQGCMYVLKPLCSYAKASGVSLGTVLSMNR